MKRQLKEKQCKAPDCGKQFMPRVSTQVCCSPVCALNYAVSKRVEKHNKEERRADKEKLDKLKTRRTHLNDAQAIFNKFIRLRDDSLPCISCGEHRNSYDAGHYRSVGAAPQLRFNEDNVHKQCVHCNQHKSGNAIEYRIGLVKRIGAARVEALECANQAIKWTIEEARSIKALYQQKIKDLQKQTAQK